VRAYRVPRRHFRTVLSAIRHHDRGGDRDFLLLFADVVAGAGFADPDRARGEAGARALELPGAGVGSLHWRLQSRLRPAVAWLWQRRVIRDPPLDGDAVDLS